MPSSDTFTQLTAGKKTIARRKAEVLGFEESFVQFHQTDQYDDDDDGKRASAASYTLHFELYISPEQMKNVVHCRFSVLSRCHSTTEAGEGTVTEGGSSRYTALGLLCCFFSSGSSVRCHHDVGFSPEEWKEDFTTFRSHGF